MNNIDCIFFDLGSTLIDETLAYEHRFRDSIVGKDISYEKVYKKAIEFYKQGKRGDLETFKFFNLPKTEWHTEDEILYPNTVKVLDNLSQKYKLGIIANQNCGTEKRLEHFGILKYFDIVVSSAEEGVAKPNPEIFNRAVSRADTYVDRCVMIGDRLDNDIVPAKRMGFKTVWVRQGFARFVPVMYVGKWADFIFDGIGAVVLLNNII